MTEVTCTEYVIPGKTYADGTIGTYEVYHWASRVSFDELYRLAKDPDSDALNDDADRWRYILNNYTNYRALYEHFTQWGHEWPPCESCAALRADDEPHGLDIECKTCEGSMEAMSEEAQEWIHAVEVGIARWAKRQWPQLDISAATYHPYDSESEITDETLAAAPLEPYVILNESNMAPISQALHDARGRDGSSSGRR